MIEKARTLLDLLYDKQDIKGLTMYEEGIKDILDMLDELNTDSMDKLIKDIKEEIKR